MPVGSEIFSLFALAVISIGVLLLLRHYLPIRTTPLYLLVPIFFAISLPASIVLLVPIDLSSSARDEETESRGIWLSRGVLLVAWRICYWLTFVLSWFVIPVLGEYADAGYREPRGKLLFSLRANAMYYSLYLGIGLLGMAYFFVSSGASPSSFKGLVMALSYCWGLILAIYLMGHGLVAIPRSCFKNASIGGRLKRIQTRAPRVHEKMKEAMLSLEESEAQVAELGRRKTGSALDFRDWIEELVDDAHLPETVNSDTSHQITGLTVTVPSIITERYLADLSRQLSRARHSRARYIDEWEHLLYETVELQATLDSAASKRISLGRASPYASMFDRITFLTPFTRYIWKYWAVPYSWWFLGTFFTICSACIVWSEIIKAVSPFFSIISQTVLHRPESSRGQVGFFGQINAACWILYMCAAAMRTLTEVKVWRGRALVRRNTHGESASWYAMQLVKLSVPLSFNFLTFLSPDVYEQTVFYEFLGKLINLTPLGTWFDILYPIFILVPVCATFFNLYGKFKDCVGYDAVIEEEDDEEGGDSFGTSTWCEGRDLIERELQGRSSLGLEDSTADRRTFVPNNPFSREAPRLSNPPAANQSQEQRSASASRHNADTEQRAMIGSEEDEENFLDGLAHRIRNTIDTAEAPRWIQNLKKPRWMASDQGEQSSQDGSDFTRWFSGGRREGPVRL